MASINKERIETADSDKQRILRGAVIDGLSGCWNWKLSKQRNGYGQIKFKGKMCRAHRVSYQLFVGEIPDGNEVMHKCDNRSCVNPDHLSCGTHEENMNDLKRRGKKGENHSLYGRKRQPSSYSNLEIPVEINGVVYRGHNEAERRLNVAHGSVRYWVKTGKAFIQGDRRG